MSLRARLLVLLLTLLTAGLVVSGAATSALLRTYLLNRIDSQLRDSTAAAEPRLGGPGAPGDHRGGGPPPNRVSDTDIRVGRIDSRGVVVGELGGTFATGTTPFSSIPASVLASARAGRAVKFEATVDGSRYRGLAGAAAPDGDVVVALAPLHDLNATLSRLRGIEALVALGVLGLAALGSMQLVRVGLRPLRDMADTADAIAGGDAERRIAVSGGTEVAALGTALNAAFDARKASEAKLRAFIADASHELRTPLTSIRGYAELLRSGAAAKADERTRAVTRIESEAARMGGLVDDMLMLARLDQGRPLERAPVELTAVAADAVADARAVDAHRSVTLVAPESVVVEGDDARLRQVVANLLANARQHTPPGTSIDVHVTRSAGVARIDVSDDGPGIAADVAPHVFDRFWRGDPAHGRGGRTDGGSGLGLAIVAALAEAHGGRASLEPSAKGAHFVVTLPLRGVANSYSKPGGVS